MKVSWLFDKRASSMVLDISQEKLDQPLEEVLSAERDPDQSEGIPIVEQLDEEAQRKLEVIQSLLEPCDRATYGEQLREAADKLGCSVRTVQRLVKRWEVEGVSALVTFGRADQGKHRISEF